MVYIGGKCFFFLVLGGLEEKVCFQFLVFTDLMVKYHYTFYLKEICLLVTVVILFGVMEDWKLSIFG